MPRTRLGRILLLLGAALAALALLEGVARLLAPPPRRFYERMAGELPLRWNALYTRHFRNAKEGFEATWHFPAELAEDSKNFVADPALGFRLTPGLALDAVNYTLPSEKREKNHWSYNSNAEGWRGPLRGERAAAKFTWAVLGDSSSFGWGLEESQSWPARLAALLGSDARVFNRAIPGYSSYQGTILLPEVLKDVSPDVVSIGYGGNDATPGPLSDREMDTELRRPLTRARSLASRLALTRLLIRGLSYFQPMPEFRPRVAPEDFRKNLEEMAAKVQERGKTALLLGLCEHSEEYREALLAASGNSRAPLLDFPADADSPRWINAPPAPACEGQAVLEAARASAEGQAAIERTVELLGRADPYFPDHCHPSPWGAVLVAQALKCRVDSGGRSL